MNNDLFQTKGIFADITDPTVATIYRTVCDKKMTADISGEYTLPDHLPEMRKLLRVSVIPTAPSKFISGNSVQFGGGVDYNICYVGADGKTYGTVFSGEYSFNAPFDPDAEYDVDRGLTANADIVTESVVGRVISARKLGLKARLCAKIMVIGITGGSLSPWVNDEAHAHTQKLMKSAEAFKNLIGSNDEIVLRDTLGASEGGERVVFSDCSVFIEEMRGGEGYVDCRGTVKVRYLMANDKDELPHTVEKRYSLSETVELEGMKEGAPCTASCVCTGIETSSETEGDSIECAIRMRLMVQGFVPENVNYVNDAYSTVCETACRKSTAKLPVMSCCGIKNMTFDGSVPLEKLNLSASKDNISIVAVSANASVADIEYYENSDKAAANGTVTFNILYSSVLEGGKVELSSAETELPFRLDGYDASGRGKMAFCSACVFDSRARLGASELEVGCEIALSCAATSELEIDTVADVEVFGEAANGAGGISLCFPGSDDSVWSVAKKYRVPVDSVRRENEIPAGYGDDAVEGLGNIKYLIV